MLGDDLPNIGSPASRALAAIGVTQLSQLVEHDPEELLALHGFGPRALGVLQDALAKAGLSFRSGIH